MTALTRKVLRYQTTHDGFREILEEVSPSIYDFPRRKLPRDEDATGDFYVYFYPRLLRLLARFRDQGKPFEAYLYSVLTYQFKSFLCKRRQAEKRWNVTLRLDPGEGYTAPESSSFEDADSPLLLPAEVQHLLDSRVDKRNFLLLLLKQPSAIAATDAAPLAELTGRSPRQLLQLAESLEDAHEPSRRRLETLRSRRNMAHAHARLLEADLNIETDPQRRAALSKDLFRTQSRLRKAILRMSRVAIAPTNKQIASALGIPKGTVDSGLFWFKKKLTQVLTSSKLESA